MSQMLTRIRHRSLLLLLALVLLAAGFMPTAAMAAANTGPANRSTLTGRMPPQHRPGHHPDQGHNPGWCQTTYRVRRGDNLTRIARHFGVSVQALVYANNIHNPNRIFAGQVLCIP